MNISTEALRTAADAIEQATGTYVGPATELSRELEQLIGFFRARGKGDQRCSITITAQGK